MFTHVNNNQTSTSSMNPTGDTLTAELQRTTTIDKPVVVGEGQRETRETLNPTGDKFTAELQRNTHIEQPAVIGEGERTALSEKLGATKEAVVSGVEYTGEKIVSGAEKLGEGLVSGAEKLGEGLVSGVEYTGEKIVSGVEFTGAKLQETGEKIGETLVATGEKIGETLVMTGEKIEQSIQKAAEVVAEEKAKVELPGVVTLFTSGAARIFGHLTGTVTATHIPSAPFTPIVTLRSSDRKETISRAGRFIEKPIEKPISQAADVISVKEQPIQSGTQQPAALHLPNLKVRDIPLNRAVEEKPPTPASDKQLPKLGKEEVQDGAQFLATMERKTEEAVQAEAAQWAKFVYIHPTPTEQRDTEGELKKQLPSLTSQTALDVATFIKKAEEEHKVDNLAASQSEKVDNAQSEAEQLPNLTSKVVSDGATFIDQAEQQKKLNQQEQGAKGITVSKQLAADPQLPSMSSFVLQDGIKFLDAVQNSNQSL